MRARSTRVRIEVDGWTEEFRTMNVLVANSPFTGAAIPVAPRALMDDGMLDATVYLAKTKLDLAKSLIQRMRGVQQTYPDVFEFRARRIVVRSRRRLPVHADDQLIGRTPAVFETIPGALTVFVGSNAPALRRPETGSTEGALPASGEAGAHLNA
jgi:diacylglycerol kinase family enzyme